MSVSENYITCREDNGSINISEDVVSSLVRASVAEIEGVAGFSNTAGSELAERIGIKTVNKGLKVSFEDGVIIIDVIITVSYGCSIVGVARTVQDKVLNVVQSSTGIDKTQVNVHVAGIVLDK